jgi:tRNA threonylcarbamoyladenosine biosynthesis protein TsaE
MIGRRLTGGEVIELRGDVGSGKTTLVQGILAGMGFGGEVPSPTFTLSRSYPVRDSLTFYHFDLYRLGGHDIVTDELNEVVADPQAVVAVEWAQSGAAILPPTKVEVILIPGKREADREITIRGNGAQAHRLIKELEHDYHA